MTTHRVTYRGPAPLAVPTATRLADAEGVELTSSATPPHRPQPDDEVLLVLTVEGPTEDVVAAVAQIGRGLPDGATLKIDERPF